MGADSTRFAARPSVDSRRSDHGDGHLPVIDLLGSWPRQRPVPALRQAGRAC